MITNDPWYLFTRLMYRHGQWTSDLYIMDDYGNSVYVGQGWQWMKIVYYMTGK